MASVRWLSLDGFRPMAFARWLSFDWLPSDGLTSDDSSWLHCGATDQGITCWTGNDDEAHDAVHTAGARVSGSLTRLVPAPGICPAPRVIGSRSGYMPRPSRDWFPLVVFFRRRAARDEQADGRADSSRFFRSSKNKSVFNF
eukprot:945866-Prorocentrum_minimum.AAC.11